MSSTPVHINFLYPSGMHINSPEVLATQRYWVYVNVSSGGSGIGFIFGSAAGVRTYLEKHTPSATHWTVTAYDCPRVA